MARLCNGYRSAGDPDAQLENAARLLPGMFKEERHVALEPGQALVLVVVVLGDGAIPLHEAPAVTRSPSYPNRMLGGRLRFVASCGRVCAMCVNNVSFAP